LTNFGQLNSDKESTRGGNSTSAVSFKKFDPDTALKHQRLLAKQSKAILHSDVNIMKNIAI